MFARHLAGGEAHQQGKVTRLSNIGRSNRALCFFWLSKADGWDMEGWVESLRGALLAGGGGRER